MPKKEETPKTEKAEAAKKASEAKSASKAAQVFKHTGNEPSVKLAPQAQGIVNILKEAGKKGLTRSQLVEAMDGVIETRQPQSRILGYYQKLLVESGAVVIEDAA